MLVELLINEDPRTLAAVASLIKEVTFGSHFEVTYNEEGFGTITFIVLSGNQEAWDDIRFRLEGWENEYNMICVPEWYK